MSGTNSITAAGLTIQTQPDIVDEINNGTILFPGYLVIFPGANTDPNSPDGQLIYIFAQGKEDVLEFLQQIYDSFDPDQAIGVSLDSRCAINGVIRNSGSYTQQVVTVTVSQALVLQGIDIYPNNPFIVADQQGNQYELLTTQSFTVPGSANLNFEALLQGPIQSGIGTITTISTPTLGVVSVLNSVAPSSVGILQETDAALRIRRANSVSLPSKGYLEGLIGAITDVPGVNEVLVLENDASTTDGNGIPGHSIWVIVSATSTAYPAVAQAIYVKRNAGCGQTHPGNGAAGTANLSGTSVSTVNITAPGFGYAVAPNITFVGGGGTGATGTATINSLQQVTGITVTAGGTGYTSAPTIVFNQGTISTAIQQRDDTFFPIVFDTPVQDNLSFSAQVDAITGSVDLTALANDIAAEVTYNIGQSASASAIVALIMSLYPNVYVTGALVNAYGGTPASIKAPSALNHQFVLPVGNITLTS